MAMPGPRELGRGVVVPVGMDPPDQWLGCTRMLVDGGVLDHPEAAVATLHQAWFDRRPVVVELGIDAKELQEPEVCSRPVYGLSPRFEFTRERLHFLVWANNYDARTGDPVWWHGRKAARSFKDLGVDEIGPADIALADRTALYVDGGPFEPPPPPAGTGIVHRWNTEAGSLSSAGTIPRGAELAADQLAAVRHETGGARVIAPAGSGKTRVLIERLRHIIEDRGAEPSTVTALAFNTKAAAQMRERCDGLVVDRPPHIQTLNSLGLWICTEFGSQGRLRTLEEPQVRDLIQQVFEVRRQANADTVQPYLDALSAVRLSLVPPTAVEARIPDARGLSAGFDAYRAVLGETGAIDFDEQIYRAIEILLSDPVARGSAQRRCRHLLVDEFQDLNPAHMLLIRLLCAPHYNCFGVGDDDQVIYGYSGATPEYLINFKEYFPGASEYALEVNYRCPPAVVIAATHLLSYNKTRITKTVTTPAERADNLPAYDVPLKGRGPVSVVSEDIDELPKSALGVVTAWRAGGVPLEDVAVLARVNSALLPIQVALVDAGVPCTAPLGLRVLQRTGIRTALAYLRMAQSPESIRPEDVIETIRRPSRGIAPKVQEMLTKRSGTSVEDIRRLASRLSGRDVPKLLEYADSIESVVRPSRTSTIAALRTIRVDIGLGSTMDVLDASGGAADRSTHLDDLLALESLASLHTDAASFESWLRELLNKGSSEGPAVHVSTIHKIKGREWGHVVVYGASKGLLPHRLSDDMEGERRVFHVALTRAVRQVVFASDRKEPSPFLDELDGSRSRDVIVAGTRSDGGRGGRELASWITLTRGGENQRPDRRQSKEEPQRRRRSKSQTKAGPERVAEIGLEIEHGGHAGRVIDLTQSAAVIRVGTAQLKVPFGSDVRVNGTSVRLTAPSDSGDTAKIEQRKAALRHWRSEAAKAAAVPAYVVLNDSELAGIAARPPSTLGELAACKGMGPIRLERWGDELLATLHAAMDSPATDS
jgi:DNA helicase II / ATP-dependent DNA helicase PcrA